MPSLKEVRVRIASIHSIEQITSAMKMVSASKLRKTQNAVLKLRPYSAKLTEIAQNVYTGSSIESPYTGNREKKNILFVVVASNKGLCGSFNLNIIKYALNQIKEYQLKNKQCKIHLLCVGKRVSDYFKKENYSIVGIRDEVLDNLTFEKTAEITEQLMSDFTSEKYDQIDIIYNKFKTAATQTITKELFLPVINENKERNTAEIEYIFEPNKEEIVKNILPLALKTQFYKAILNSFASEHGARMITMQKATDNASELLKELQLSYNKARQAAITNELIEIMSAANALNG